jgi:hypothetical protein
MVLFLAHVAGGSGSAAIEGRVPSQSSQEIDRTHDADTMKASQPGEVTVAGYDETGVSRDSAFENTVVVRIGRDHFQSDTGLNNFGYPR